MQFIETRLAGAFVIEIDKKGDERGFFARSFCTREFDRVGLARQMVQTNVSVNKNEGTLRGMHYQTTPFEEAKLLRCTRGAIYDVIVDVRLTSDTCGQWIGVTLTEENYNMLYVPEGFAHGFITLENDTEVVYQVSQHYAPGYERGLRFDDPVVGIEWPTAVRVISEKDRSWPPFEPAGIKRHAFAP